MIRRKRSFLGHNTSGTYAQSHLCCTAFLQLLLDASLDGLGQEDKLYLGSEIAKGTICFSPKLREWMAVKIGEDAKMMKGLRMRQGMKVPREAHAG